VRNVNSTGFPARTATWAATGLLVACGSAGVVLVVLAFQPFVGTYGYLPTREIALLVVVAVTFGFYILWALRIATAKFPIKTALLAVSSIEGLLIGVFGIGTLRLSSLGVLTFPPAFLAAAGLIEFAMSAPAERRLARILLATSLASLVLLAPGIFFLIPLYTTQLYVYLPGALAQAFPAAMFSLLYSVTTVGILVGHRHGTQTLQVGHLESSEKGSV